MLLSFLGINVRQRDVVAATEAASKIKNYGMTVTELGRAVAIVAPHRAQFWYKDQAKLGDIQTLIEAYRYPVGVEWQGIFGKYSDGDDGHYAVVTHVDQDNKEIVMADPFKPFAGVDRLIRLDSFRKRWWDENEMVDPVSHARKMMKDVRMLFIVTRHHETFPRKLGMKRG